MSGPHTTQPKPKSQLNRRSSRRGERVAVKPLVKPRTAAARHPSDLVIMAYDPGEGVDRYVNAVRSASPMQLIELERRGVKASFIKALATSLDLPFVRLLTVLGLPKATAERKSAADANVAGSAGQAAIGVAKLLAVAKQIVANSTAEDAKDFDTAKWLGQWIERPQAALGGCRPSELLDTPTGFEVVARLLGSVESGAYQ